MATFEKVMTTDLKIVVLWQFQTVLVADSEAVLSLPYMGSDVTPGTRYVSE